jgi:autotransporter-associated beta strand protein
MGNNGSGSLTKIGAGTLTLASSDAYGGGTMVDGGVLNFSSLSSLGTGTTLTIAGGTLQYANGNTADISTLTVTLGSGGGTVDTGGNNVTFAAAIGNGGSGGLTKAGLGTLVLNGATNSGDTSVSGGTLELAGGSLGSANISTSAGAILTVDSGATISPSTNLTDAGTANFNNAAQTIATLNGSGTVNLGPGNVLTVGGGGNFTGVITDPGATLIISGGDLVLTGANTYTGNTDITGGSLEIASPGALASGSIDISTGGKLTVDSGAAISSATNLDDAGTANFNNDAPTIATLNGSGVLNVNGTSLTITNGGSYSGAIDGNASLIVAGGLLTFTSAGTIAVSAITIAPSATLDINAVVTGYPAVVVDGNLNFGAADSSNDPASGILVWNLGSLTVGSVGDVAVGLAGSSTTRAVVTTSSLSNVAGGTLDLTNNDMIVFGSNDMGVPGQGDTSEPDPAAIATEITSSSVAATPALMTLALVQNQGQFDTFDGQQINVDDVVVKYTLFGDADLSGVVDAGDYALIDNGFNSQSGPDPLSGWYNGDFNGDGKINGDDYTLIDNAYNSQNTAALAVPAEIIASNTSQIAVATRASGGPFSPGPVVSVASSGQQDTGDIFGDLKKHARKSVLDLLA